MAPDVAVCCCGWADDDAYERLSTEHYITSSSRVIIIENMHHVSVGIITSEVAVGALACFDLLTITTTKFDSWI